MAAEKRVAQITARDVDFGQWYTDVVKKAELVDYSSVKGCVILRPYAHALWSNIQKALDAMFAATGHENVSMPLFIPESLLNKEKELVEGFAPEVAWVTHGGSEKLTERLCVRPTSETLFCEHYAHVVQSWRDLPKLYNQWCSVVRWEKTTRPFLRSREFWWQEGHTIHATAQEAEEETRQMLEVYAQFAENHMAMPVVKGTKTQQEKFPGAEYTLTIECMMHDGRALQSGTSHYFGDKFAKAFDIAFLDKNNMLATPHQTSWGLSTRVIGGIIMTHGDDNGLVLPPKLAPVQIIVIPIAQHKPGVLEAAAALKARLEAAGLRVKMDDSDQTPGWKFAEHEMKGVPLRLELGPRDIDSGVCVAARRDNGDKQTLPLADIEVSAAALLDGIQNDMLARARQNLESRTRTAQTLEELCALAASQGGYVQSMWCGDAACEDKVREKSGMKSRCLPFDQTPLGDACVCCGKPAQHRIVWGFQY